MNSKFFLTIFFALLSSFGFSQLLSGVNQGPAEGPNPFLAGQTESYPENLRIISIVNKVEEKIRP